jgi:hypothetical protein
MMNNQTSRTSMINSRDLGGLLLLLLKEHNQSWYNSKSITELIQKEGKFASMKLISHSTIREHLDELVKEKKLRAHKSGKGNWLLYKI